MKINFKQIGKSIGKFGKRIAPAVSITVGVGCTAYAAYKTAKVIPVAKIHIEQKKAELGVEKLPVKETVKACYKDFREPFIFGTAGVTAVVAGVFDYERTIKDLGATVSVASALLSEQGKEMQKTLGEAKANDIQQKAISNVAHEGGNGARIITPGGTDIFIEEATGREYITSEAWVRECFSRYMDEFVDNPDDRPPLSTFYDMLAPNVRKSGAPIGDYLTFPYDRGKSTATNRVDLYFEPSETVDGKAAFMWRYSRPMEYAH